MHALILRAVAQAFDRESDRIADRGFATGETDRRIGELLADGLQIERERHQQVRARAEQDQADAIADCGA